MLPTNTPPLPVPLVLALGLIHSILQPSHRHEKRGRLSVSHGKDGPHRSRVHPCNLPWHGSFLWQQFGFVYLSQGDSPRSRFGNPDVERNRPCSELVQSCLLTVTSVNKQGFVHLLKCHYLVLGQYFTDWVFCLVLFYFAFVVYVQICDQRIHLRV